ncbi:hypothetical protein CVD19_12615 [Bacillus sp. T33-2]|nr:hypothetical protein CVD19_12615 [Bacillus sp. T33-2]
MITAIEKCHLCRQGSHLKKKIGRDVHFLWRGGHDRLVGLARPGVAGFFGWEFMPVEAPWKVTK